MADDRTYIRVHDGGGASRQGGAIPLVDGLLGDAESGGDVLPTGSSFASATDPVALHRGQLVPSGTDLDEAAEVVVVANCGVDSHLNGAGVDVHASRLPDATEGCQDSLTDCACGGAWSGHPNPHASTYPGYAR